MSGDYGMIPVNCMPNWSKIQISINLETVILRPVHATCAAIQQKNMKQR